MEGFFSCMRNFWDFFFMLTLWRVPTLCLKCELLEKIKVLLSPQLFHQYQQDVYKPWLMLGITKKKTQTTVLCNKQSPQHFSAMENWLKSYGQAVIGRKTQQGFPLLTDVQEADCRTLWVSNFTLCTLKWSDIFSRENLLKSIIMHAELTDFSANKTFTKCGFQQKPIQLFPKLQFHLKITED